jgi:hypothetical protein
MMFTVPVPTKEASDAGQSLVAVGRSLKLEINYNLIVRKTLTGRRELARQDWQGGSDRDWKVKCFCAPPWGHFLPRPCAAKPAAF